MSKGVEFDQISQHLCVWHQYDPAVKAELFSTGLTVGGGIYLIDPSAPGPPEFDLTGGAATPAGIILTNSNHLRESEGFAARLNVPIHTSAETQRVLNLPAAREIASGAEMTPGLSAIEIEGAAPGEIALYSREDGGTVILGDALINMGSYGFTFLPAKYCANPRLMRKSLRQLLAYRFERLLFAHGMPIVSNARARLEMLLNEVV